MVSLRVDLLLSFGLSIESELHVLIQIMLESVIL